MLSIPDLPIPVYHSTGSDENDPPNLSNEPPSYDIPGPSNLRRHASRRLLHEFSLDGSDKRPWATVRFSSWAPSPRSLPVFLNGQEVSGHVVLDLRHAESIKGVEVSIKGFVRALNKEINFFHVSRTLWDSSFGDPRSPNRSAGTKYKGKLEGTYSWSFSIVLPQEIAIEPKLAKELKLNRIEHLPPSLDGLGLNSVINYRLVVNIRRRGLLKADSVISTLVGYTPITRPDRPSNARQTAYMERTLIPGPIFDPSGWRILQEIRISGTIFKQREISVIYILALATPLAYTRGTVIPCHLTIRSSDRQALDLLSSPSAPRVILRRKLTTRAVITPVERSDLTAVRDNEALTRAIWAPKERRTNECILVGELSVPLACVPTFAFGEFKVEYFVDVLQPTTAGFQPTSDEKLCSTEVEVVSAYAENSPRPRAYITPAHDASHRVTQAAARGRHLAALALEGGGRSSTSEAVRAANPGTVPSPPGPEPEPDADVDSSMGVVSSHQIGAFGQMVGLQNVIRSSGSSSSPTAGRTRRLNRRFSAI